MGDVKHTFVSPKTDGTDITVVRPSNWNDGHTLNLEATDIEVSELGTATYDDVQDYANFFGDRTILSGGAISDNGDGTATVALGTAWAKATDSNTAVGKFFDFSADASVALTNLITNYIYLDYNAGTPQIVVSTAITTHGFKQDHIHIGTIFRDGTTIHFHQENNIGIGRINIVDMYHLEKGDAERVSGLITSDGGALSLSITTGVIYEGLSRHATVVDGSTWSTWYTSDSGTTWTEVTTQSTINNTQYNNIAAGLATLTANRYAVHWVYCDIDGENLHIVYGQGNYTANQAEEASIPSTLPNLVTNYGVLIAKVVVKKSDTTLIIALPWTTVFTSSLATDHGSLAGLTDDDHTQYIKDSEFAQDSGFLVGTGAGTFQEETGATLRTSIDTYSTTETDTEIDNDVGTHAALDTGVHGAGGDTLATDADITTHAAIKSANATLGHVIVENGSDIDVDGDGKLTLGTHKDNHDPNDGSDALDTANASDIPGVQAAGTGTSHSLARADHAHQIQHSIADNHIVTIDDAAAAVGEYAKFTANGIEGAAGAGGGDVSVAGVPADGQVAIWTDGTTIEGSDFVGAYTIMVAASDATAAEKVSALASGGTVCDGTDDGADIETAAAALLAGTRGILQLSTGTFLIDDGDCALQGCTVSGMGGTFLYFDNGATILELDADADYVWVKEDARLWDVTVKKTAANFTGKAILVSGDNASANAIRDRQLNVLKGVHVTGGDGDTIDMTGTGILFDADSTSGFNNYMELCTMSDISVQGFSTGIHIKLHEDDGDIPGTIFWNGNVLHNVILTSCEYPAHLETTGTANPELQGNIFSNWVINGCSGMVDGMTLEENSTSGNIWRNLWPNFFFWDEGELSGNGLKASGNAKYNNVFGKVFGGWIQDTIEQYNTVWNMTSSSYIMGPSIPSYEWTNGTNSVGIYGRVFQAVCGSSIVSGQLCTMSSDEKMDPTDADTEALTSGLLGVALEDGENGDAIHFLGDGFLRLAGEAGWTTPGEKLYVSTTVGEITPTAPSGAGDFVRVVGWTSDFAGNIMHFKPSTDYYEHDGTNISKINGIALAGGGAALDYTELNGATSTTAAGEGAGDGAWIDWDLSGTLPVGTVSIDILITKLVATDSAGCRTNGSGLAREFELLKSQAVVLAVPVASDRIIEIQSDDVSDGDTFQLIGYWS